MKKCVKCGFTSEENKEKFKDFLCNICYTFSPDDIENFKSYASEKINPEVLASFRKYIKDLSKIKKEGMIKGVLQGKIMSRIPFGYRLENSQIVPDQNFGEVEEIFWEFLNGNISLTQLAKKHKFSVNGIKKILTNFTYIGKIKFDNKIHEGSHEPIVSTTLFNHVQNKLEKLGLKNLN